jgi:hypothetical protein
MNHKLLIVLGLAVTAAEPAHADTASDRVFLTTGGTGCPTGSTSLKRIRQSPDGSQVAETAEFVVPAGKYLEITSVEYTTPSSTAWATGYTQSLALNIRQRSGTGATNVFLASFANHPLYDEDANNVLHGFGQFVSGGGQTHATSFPAGPLMSSAGRLCFTAPSNFHIYGGSVRVRGRLIASDGMIVSPTDGTVANP